MSDPILRKELRKVLCERMRQHGFQKNQLGGPCDGESVVCSWCDNTSWLQLDAIKRSVPETVKGAAEGGGWGLRRASFQPPGITLKALSLKGFRGKFNQ